MDNTVMIDWNSSETQLLINPRFPEQERACLLSFEETARSLPGLIWMTTSGARGFPKWVGLSRSAILSSAAAVNKHLESNDRDLWLNPLPDFHVGGFGIYARAYLSGARVVSLNPLTTKWDPEAFIGAVMSSRATLSALVPTQLYDLISKKICAPPTLRNIIIGGSAMDIVLGQRALKLGWRILPTYGMTECSSQVATASNEDPLGGLKPLSHISLGVNKEGIIRIKSPSLLSAYGIYEGGHWKIIDPKLDGWFTTEDKGVFEEGILRVEGREGDIVKIGGEWINFQKLETILERAKSDLRSYKEVALMLIRDPRLGFAIQLNAEGKEDDQLRSLIQRYHKYVLPFEKIRKVHFVSKIEKTCLDKVKRI